MNKNTTINVGLIGFGTIGSGVVTLFKDNIGLIENKTGKNVKLKKVVDLDITTDRGVDIDPSILSTDVTDILDDPEIDIVIELIGGYQPAENFILTAMENGKHVITANKALLAKEWEKIIKTAQDNKVRICFEASVGGGIPILQPLNESLASNKIKAIYGIINGTANYILTKMTEDKLEFEDVLKEAQIKGYAEQDPTFDVEGFDTAQKLIILSILGFGVYVKQEQFHVEGISKITSRDIEFISEELDSVIKLLAIAQISDGELDLRVHPTLIHKEHLLASVNDAFNGIYVVGDAVGPVMMYGQGAGKMPTASAVVGDCLEIINNMEKKVDYGPKISLVDNLKNINEIISKYYIRLAAVDQPGVLHAISGILSDFNISIESVSQKNGIDDHVVQIFMLTHEVLEKNLAQAMEKIEDLDVVKGNVLFIRVLDE